MVEDFTAAEASVGEMHRRREVMADGRRYIIYYTFGADETADAAAGEPGEVSDDV